MTGWPTSLPSATPAQLKEARRQWVLEQWVEIASHDPDQRNRLAALAKLGDEYGAGQSKALTVIGESLEGMLEMIRAGRVSQPQGLPQGLPPPLPGVGHTVGYTVEQQGVEHVDEHGSVGGLEPKRLADGEGVLWGGGRGSGDVGRMAAGGDGLVDASGATGRADTGAADLDEGVRGAGEVSGDGVGGVVVPSVPGPKV